jgi:putative ABC transport system permease protein
LGRLTIKNLAARKLRLALTAFAVVLSVAFMAGTFVLTDTMGAVFDDLFADVNKGVDVAVRGRQAFEDTAGGPGAQVIREPVDASIVPLIKTVDGVGTVEGSVTGIAKVVTLVDGRPDEAIQPQAPTLGVSWGRVRGLNQAFGGDGRAEVGRRPRAPNEVALDEVTAEKAGVSERAVRRCASGRSCRGARVEMIFFQHAQTRFDVVGIFKFGTAGNLAGATLAAFETSRAQDVMNRVGLACSSNRNARCFDQISITAEAGTDDAELARRVRATLRSADVEGAEVLTGAQLAEDQSDEIREGLSFFSYFLLIFALVALFVGAFMIYNTFSIIVAQRARELGLLRALGASPRQVMVSVVVEALVVGLVSSIIGLALGIGVALGLQELMRALDVELPSGDAVLATRTIVVSILAGTVVTLVSAIAPARRAARVAPMVVLRAHAETPSSGRRRYVVGGVLLGVGMVLLGLALVDVVSVSGTAGIVGGLLLPIAAIFVGAAMLSPLVAVPVAQLIGWVPAQLRGVTGRLARENSTRNPRRTASAAAALMVGLALMTLVAILGASINKTTDDVLANDLRAEFVLTTENFFPSSPEAAAAVREALPGSEVTEFRFGQLELAGETKAMLGVDTNLGETLDVHPERGALRRFRDGGVLLFEDAYDELPARQWRAKELRVRFAKTGDQTLPIAGTFAKKDAVGNDYLLPMPLFEANFTDQADVFTAIKIPPEASLREARREIDRALEPFPDVEAQDQTEYAETISTQVNQFLNLMYALLLFAVVIALLGIMNTLALSVFERTHELGLLRAVGMSRPQLRGMIRYEAVIVAVFGSLLGLVLGLAFGRAMLQALESEGIRFALPTGTLVVFVVLAAVAGFACGTLPARRAARLDVLRAVQSE